MGKKRNCGEEDNPKLKLRTIKQRDPSLMKSVSYFTWFTFCQLHRLCYSLQKVDNSFLWLLRSQYPWIQNKLWFHSTHFISYQWETEQIIPLSLLFWIACDPLRMLTSGYRGLELKGFFDRILRQHSRSSFTLGTMNLGMWLCLVFMFLYQILSLRSKLYSPVFVLYSRKRKAMNSIFFITPSESRIRFIIN